MPILSRWRTGVKRIGSPSAPEAPDTSLGDLTGFLQSGSTPLAAAAASEQRSRLTEPMRETPEVMTMREHGVAGACSDCPGPANGRPAAPPGTQARWDALTWREPTLGLR
jgi:hypothetical protein